MDRAPAEMRRPASGDGQAPVTALMLHGMGAGTRTWDDLAPALAPHLELWAAHLPWAVSGDPSWAAQPDATPWILRSMAHVRHCTGREPDLIIAHSFAANVTLQVLTQRRAAVPAAVLLSPFYRPDHRDLDWMAVIPGLEACFASVADRMSGARGAQLRDEVKDAMVRRLLQSLGDLAPLRFYEVCRQTSGLDLGSLATPMLLVGGADDQLGAHPDGVRALARRLPMAALNILDGCGHFPMTERPGDLAATMNDFTRHVIPVSQSTAPGGVQP